MVGRWTLYIRCLEVSFGVRKERLQNAVAREVWLQQLSLVAAGSLSACGRLDQLVLPASRLTTSVPVLLSEVLFRHARIARVRMQG